MHKLAIVGSAGIPAKYGGFETLAQELVLNFSDKIRSFVYCSSRMYSKEEQKEGFSSAELIYIPLKANGWQSIIYDCWSIINAAKYADSILMLGVPGAVILPVIKIFSNSNIIVHLDGLEWKRDKWNFLAKWFLKFSEKIAIKFADKYIADNKALSEYIKETYNVTAKTIAYGADHTFKSLISNKEFFELFPGLKNKTFAFSVCRIEPENNIHIILQAFKQLKSINLVMVGNWKNSNYGNKLFESFDQFENIHLIDPIYNNTILDKFKEKAFLYIHGHSAGGTNPSLVEAMYAELPVIAFDVSFNRFTTDNKAYYFKDTNDLIQNIKDTDSEKLRENALSMKQIALKKYIWSKVTKQYIDLLESDQPEKIELKSEKNKIIKIKHKAA